MATSSITETLRVNNPKLLEAYAEALEKSETEGVQPKITPVFETVTDSDEIRNTLLQNIEIWSKKDK